MNIKTEKIGLPLACRNISANWGSCRLVRSQLIVSYRLLSSYFSIYSSCVLWTGSLGHLPLEMSMNRIRETLTCAENIQGEF